MKRITTYMRHCPRCGQPFLMRTGKRCRHCQARLVYPGEIFYRDEDVYVWRSTLYDQPWHLIPAEPDSDAPPTVRQPPGEVG